MTFLTPAGQREIERAIETIEGASGAEVVVTIRPRARYSLVQHGVVGIIAALGMLAFTLFSPVEFTLWQIFVMPIFAGIMGAVLVEAVPPLYRWLMPTWARYDHVREAAYATFVERGIHSTRDRTGILVYVALRERMVEIVGDLEVVKHHGIEVLAAWAGALEAQLPLGAEAFGKQLATLADDLAKTLPRRADDIDELSNTVHVFGAPPRQRKVAPS
jgi:putative membrane protein